MAGRLILYVVTYVVFLVLIVAPFIGLVAGALSQGGSAFYNAIVNPEALFSLKMTIEITAVATVLNTLFGVLGAWVIVRRSFPGWRILDSVADWPVAVSPVIGGLALVLLYGPASNLGGFLQTNGVQVIFALPGMVLATLFVTFPFVLRELVPVLRELGSTYEEAAYTLGASRWRTFWSVTWTAIRQSVVSGSLLTAARAMGEFGAVVVVSGNIVLSTQTATLYVYQAATDNDLVAAGAVSLLLAVMSFVVLLVFEITKHGRVPGVHEHRSGTPDEGLRSK